MMTAGRKSLGMRLAALLGTWIALLVCGGCAFLTGGSGAKAPREIAATSSGQPILPAELDELTRAFADRYVGLLYSACDALKKDNPDPVQRREAQDLLVDCATNVYDIASNADAFTRMLDLVVVTTLVSQVWIDDDRAAEVFPGRDDVLVRALHHGRVEAWALAAQVLRPEQLDLMDYLIWDWRRNNPDMVRASFVRFSNFAIGRGRSADAETVAAIGLLGNVEQFATGGFLSALVGTLPAKVGEAGKSVDEARLLTERMFYMFKREPTLLRWQADAAKEGMLATPEVDRALADMHRLTDQIEQLPKNVAAERQAILAALDERKDMLDAPLANARATIGEMNQLLTSLGPASESLRETIKTADTLFARYDSWSRWSDATGSRPFDIREYTEAMKELAATAGSVGRALSDWQGVIASLDPASKSLTGMLEAADTLVAHFDHPGGTATTEPATQPSRPFDIREYTDALKELALSAGKVDDVLKSSNELVGSSEWNRRVQQVNESVDERVRKAVEQSQQVVNTFFWRVYAALGVLFVILIVCLVTAFVLMRRLVMRVAANTAQLRSEADHTANDTTGPGANAAGAGPEGGVE